MAISYSHDFTTISGCESTTDSGTHYRLNGVNSGNPLAEADAYVQGAGCIANKCGATTGATDTGGHFNHTSTFDLTGKHLFIWRLISTAGNMLTKANAGVSVGLTNTSTTSTTAWSSTNYKRWNVDGADTQPNSEGWKCYVIDPSGAADASAGSLNLASVKNVGYLCRQNTSISTALNNVFVDAIRAGSGLTITASSAADVITMSGVFNYDATKTNSWGVITQNSGIYYGAGKVTIGSTSQANTCKFEDTDQVVVWRDFPVADTLYEFNLKGAAGNKTTMQWNSSVIRGQAGQVWNITCDANSDFKAYSCSLANCRSAVLSPGSVLDGTSLTACGTIEANGATIAGCAFANHTATQIKLDAASESSVISNSSFKSAGTGHAIQITAAGTYTFAGLTFTGYAASNGSTGNEAVYVSATTGTVTINVTGGGTAPSIRTAGATVSVVSGATVTFTGLPTGCDIVILTAGTNTILQQVDAHGSTSYAWGYSGTPTVDVGFIKPGYVPLYLRNLALSSNDSSIPVALTADRNYSA